MQETIYRHLKRLVAIPSISNTEKERQAADYLAESLRAQPYFQRYPQHTGLEPLRQDRLNRRLPWGLIRGNGSKTIILTGHYDVVDTEEYGDFQSFAYDIEAWERAEGSVKERLCQMLSGQAREDLESGQWIFGRGACDMKGGLAIGLALMEWFGGRRLTEPELPGNLLFLSVPDEEAYSSGMRGAVPLLEELRLRYGLEYSCLIDLEPSFNEGGRQQIYIGSVGKLMPAVLVQGAKAHVVECFQGLNAVGVLSRFFMNTELSPAFAEAFEGENCPPPTWLNFRDRKESYDVSLPLRAGGYMNLLSFSKGGAEVMRELKKLGQEAFSWYEKRMEALGNECGTESVYRLPKETQLVMEYQELVKYCAGKWGQGPLEAWLEKQYDFAEKQISRGCWNFPQATLELMDRLLTFSGITTPVMVLAFAPPYYPAYHSDRLEKQQGAGSYFCRLLQQQARELFDLELEKRHYFCGISDLSYCGLNSDSGAIDYEKNAPLWGRLYSMDLEGMKRFQVPALLFGPVGVDAHRMGERVLRRSLLEEVPEILKKFIEQMFAK